MADEAKSRLFINMRSTPAAPPPSTPGKLQISSNLKQSYTTAAIAGSQKTTDEDAHLLRTYENTTVISVFDGLGGLRGGYEASRIAAKTMETFYNGRGGKFSSEDIPELQTRIHAALATFVTTLPASKLQGTFAKHQACTTMAAACIEHTEKGPAKALLAWIGDSRIYTLEPEGKLTQLSTDDTLGGGGDAPMSQFLAATMTSGWKIHAVEKNIPAKSLIMVVTDGCYSHSHNASAENEFLQGTMYSTLQDATSMDDWMNRLNTRIKSVAVDDATFGIVPIGFSSFEEMKKHYAAHGPFAAPSGSGPATPET